VAKDGALETVLHPWELFVPRELRVRDEAGVVIDEGKQKHLPFLARVGRVRDVGTVHGITLPEVAEVVSFEAAVGLGPLLVEELSRGGVAGSQVSTQSAWGDVLLRDGIGLVKGENLDNGTGGPVGLLALERLSTIEGLFGDSAGLTTIGAGLGLQAIEAIFVV
jgi:hypothetical protein